jgi:hypothetical protein
VSRWGFDKRGSLIRGESALVCFELSVGGFFRGVEQHDLGLLIVGDIRASVDSQVGPCWGGVGREELALCAIEFSQS